MCNHGRKQEPCLLEAEGGCNAESEDWHKYLEQRLEGPPASPQKEEAARRRDGTMSQRGSQPVAATRRPAS